MAAAESAALSLRLASVDLAEVTRAALTARDAQLRAAGLAVHAELDPGGPGAGRRRPAGPGARQPADQRSSLLRPGDQVTARVSATDGQGVVEIADSGPGVPADELPHVFDRLWRGRASGASSGSGISLAVVRELVGAHGGTGTSAPGSGATFTIRLPSNGHRQQPVSTYRRPAQMCKAGAGQGVQQMAGSVRPPHQALKSAA